MRSNRARRLLALATLLATVHSPVQTALAATPETLAPAVPTALPRSALEQREIRAQLSPRRYTTLAAEIGAKIQRLPVAEGAAFREGQLLVQFDCSLQQAQLNKAQATLAAADKLFKANKRLAELNSVGAVELETSQAEVLKARAEVAASQVVLGKCSIVAPYGGRVAEQKVREQQYVQAGQALLDILDDSVLELEFIVPSRWLTWLKVGAPFQVRIDETGKTYPAKVRQLGARVDPVSQSIKINAAIDGRFSDLIAGMSGQVLIEPPAE